MIGSSNNQLKQKPAASSDAFIVKRTNERMGWASVKLQSNAE